MENPEEQIVEVIHSLTQGSRDEQDRALNDYFLPNAYFVHPYCRVPSFEPWTIRVPLTNISWTVTSRWLIQLVYQWYKVLSPVILLEVDSVAFDRKTNSLYATIRQTFTIWFAPRSWWQANVKLVCLLELAHLPVDADNKPLPHSLEQKQKGGLRYRYFIRGQQDNYQVTEFLKFIDPFRISMAAWYLWQLFAVFLCAIGIPLLGPLESLYVRAFLSDDANREDQKQLQRQHKKGQGLTRAGADGQKGQKEGGQWEEYGGRTASRKRS